MHEITVSPTRVDALLATVRSGLLVEDAERYARGSADYGSKWALVLERSMRPAHAGARPSRAQAAP